MKHLFVFILILCNCNSYAQSIGPYFIGTQGDVLENDQLKLYSTIGESINNFEQKDDFAFYQGVLQSIQFVSGSNLELCTAKTGTMFFENCDDGTLFFFVRGDDGIIYDPYYDEGVVFEEKDSLEITFGFRPADFATPCSIAEQAIILTCVESTDITSSLKVLPETDLSVYPNPTNGEIGIELHENFTDATLKIVSKDGRNMYVEPQRTLAANQKIKLQLDNYPPGMYFIILTGKEGILTKKIIVSK